MLVLATLLGTALIAGNLRFERAAAGGLPSPDLSIQVDVDGDTTPDCDTRGSPPEGSCSVPRGQVFTVEVYVDDIAGMEDFDGDGEHGYTGFRASLTHAGLMLQDRPGDREFRAASGQPFWPDLGSAVCSGSDMFDTMDNMNAYVGLCGSGFPTGVESTYLGKLMEVDFTCSGMMMSAMMSAVSLRQGPSYLVDDVGKHGLAVDVNDGGAPEVLNIDCTFPWDVNGDGAVSVGDAFIVVMAFGQNAPPAPMEADLTGDGRVSIEDVAEVVHHFCEVLMSSGA
ncbi:MAG: dockerin type I domain-containing protein [Dehalococcoidia bacterium]